ncbi:unnamed protein product, partial [Didymodactylos carnosus]
SLARFVDVVKLAKENSIPVRGYVSCVVGCPYEGKISPSQVLPVVQKLIDMGCVSYEVSLGDTTGVGTPKSIKDLLLNLTENGISVEKLGIHCHDTYGLAISNIFQALEMGVRSVDSSVGGLGGCPYAKGATGNVATEDVVYLMNGLGYETGVDLEKLIETGYFITNYLGRQNNSKVAHAMPCCPSEKGIRSKTWKILLNYLLLDRTKWHAHLCKQRELYRGYIRETIIKPGLQTSSTPSEVVDHPLNSESNSSWAAYFKENEVLLQIDRDVRPDLCFFQRETEYPCNEILTQEPGFESLRKRIVSTTLKVESQLQKRLGTVELQSNESLYGNNNNDDFGEYQLLPDGHESHWEVVERILFVYCKLNVGQGYVQGMNEIIGPLYYTFATDPHVEWRGIAFTFNFVESYFIYL